MCGIVCCSKKPLQRLVGIGWHRGSVVMCERGIHVRPPRIFKVTDTGTSGNSPKRPNFVWNQLKFAEKEQFFFGVRRILEECCGKRSSFGLNPGIAHLLPNAVNSPNCTLHMPWDVDSDFFPARESKFYRSIVKTKRPVTCIPILLFWPSSVDQVFFTSNHSRSVGGLRCPFFTLIFQFWIQARSRKFDFVHDIFIARLGWFVFLQATFSHSSCIWPGMKKKKKKERKQTNKQKPFCHF